MNAGAESSPKLSSAREIGDRFRQKFGGKARVFRAPGRVNLIGEHTDYNDGFVLPVAIDSYIWVAIAPRSDSALHIYSENFEESLEIDLHAPAQIPCRQWPDYARGVVGALKDAGHILRGADILIKGEIPIGAGLSSSAAVEVALATALTGSSGLHVPCAELALLCQRAENEFVGARCGIMDQFTVSCSGRGKALLLDCRSLEYRLVDLLPGVSFVVSNTMVRHELASGEYNARRAECEQAVAILRQCEPRIKSLRDAELGDIERNRDKLPSDLYRRCLHVITENARVLEAAEALAEGDPLRFGQRMNESHESLRENYEVSCAELDLMVSLARKCEGVHGSRMTGGGFGGCTISLVRSDSVEKYRSEVSRSYEGRTGITPEIFVVQPTDGAGEIRE